jgi:hypothetical protein
MKAVQILFLVSILGIAGASHAQIIAEAFRNDDCANCRTPDDGYESFIASNPGYGVAIVYIHDNFPDPADPFYQASAADVTSLVNYYQIISDPTLIISGVNAGANLSDWKSITTEAASQPPSAEKLTLSSISNSNGTLSVKVDITGSHSGTTLKLNVMIVESDIEYSNNGSYGNLPNNLWNNIFRKMLPSSTGSAAFVLSHDTSFVYTFDPTGKNWNVANLHALAYLQDTKTGSSGSHPIYGNKTSDIGFFQNAVNNQVEASTNIGNVSSNPFSSSTRIPLHLEKPSYVKAIVYNSLGIQVATLADQTIDAPDASLTFYPHDLSAGAYYIYVMIDGKLVAVRPVIYQP